MNQINKIILAMGTVAIAVVVSMTGNAILPTIAAYAPNWIFSTQVFLFAFFVCGVVELAMKLEKQPDNTTTVVIG